MKTLAGSSESHQEDRSVDAIHKEQERESCNNCGKQHPRNKCPAYGTLCRKCGKANHWQSVCQSSKRKQFIQGRKPVFKKSIHTIEDRGDEDNDEILTISTIEVNTTEDTQHSTTHDTRDEVFATLEITQPEKKRKINLQCKVDTGAQSNVLPIRLLRIIAPEKFDDEGNLKPEVLEKNGAVLSAYGGSVIKQLGTINISCKYKEKKINCIFYVTDTSGPAILGLKECIALKLVSLHCTLGTNQLNQADPTSSFNSPAQNPGTCKKSSSYIGSHVPLEERPSITSKQELMDMYPECFNGTVGCFDDYTYHITLDPEVSPVVHAPRKVPIELKEKLQAELREMESQDIISKVTQPTDWVNSLIQTVKKTILKCRETKEDIDLALLALRTTPLSSNIPSPAELLNGRAFKSTLPGKIQPSKNQEEVRNWLKARQDNQCHYYNRNTKELPELHRDQAIYEQDPVRKTWNPARVIDQGETPRSYLIKTGTGAQLRRNRIHLRPNNASNNSANDSSDCVSQRSMTAQYSSAILRESTAAGNSANDPSSGNLTIQPSSPNPQCSSVTGKAEKGLRKSCAGREIRAPERLNL